MNQEDETVRFSMSEDGKTEVTIFRVTESLKLANLLTSLRMLSCSVVRVDCGGIGKAMLEMLKHEGINAEPLPKIPKVDDDMRLLNCRALLSQAEALLRGTPETNRTTAQANLLFDIEAMKGRC